MKVLKDNYRTVSVVNSGNKMMCDHCTSELEYDESDIEIGEYGCAFVRCPLCGCDNYIEDGEHDITLTRRNIEFPTHFARFSKETGAVDCCNNEEIRNYIHKAIDYFRANKNEFVWDCATGNLCVTVYRYEGDKNYYVQVTNDHYNTYIPFEEEDY